MLYVLSAIAVILILLYFMPIVVRLDIKKDNENDKITIGIRTLYGLIKLRSEIPFLKIVFENGRPALKYKVEVANKEKSKLLARFTKILSMREGEGLYKLYKKSGHKFLPVLRYIMSKTRISEFNLKLSLGTGDAALTGILYGVTWIVIGNIMTFTRSLLKVYNPRVAVVPIFSRVQLSLDFNCIINLKLGHIINAGIRALPAIMSSMKE